MTLMYFIPLFSNALEAMLLEKQLTARVPFSIFWYKDWGILFLFKIIINLALEKTQKKLKIFPIFQSENDKTYWTKEQWSQTQLFSVTIVRGVGLVLNDPPDTTSHFC